MSRSRIGLVALGLATMLAACDYVVVPSDDRPGASSAAGGRWTGIATKVDSTDPTRLVVELTIRNDTGDWSTLLVPDGRPADLVTTAGSSGCATVEVSTGGHRLAPGFQMSGFTGGTLADPIVERIRVECEGATASPGSKLVVHYDYDVGPYNYYDPEASRASADLSVDLDAVATGLTYPVATPVEGLIQPADVPIEALNDASLQLAVQERTGPDLVLTWTATNPSEYPTSVHIGNPPVIGADGVVYGRYENPDLASVPVVDPGGEASWDTTVTVPADVTGLIVLASVEAVNARTYVNHAIDIGEG